MAHLPPEAAWCLGVLPVSRFSMYSPLFGCVSPSRFHDVLCAVIAHCNLASLEKDAFMYTTLVLVGEPGTQTCPVQTDVC